MSVIYDPNKSPQRPQSQPAPNVRPPKPRRQRKPISFAWVKPLVVSAVVILLAGAAVYGLLPLLNRQGETETSQSQGLPADQELVRPLHVYLSASDAKANKQVNASFVAQKDWRSTRQNGDNKELISSSDYLVSKFSFASGQELTPAGEMIIENVTNWANENGSSQLTGYKVLNSSADKRKYLDELIELRSSRTADAAAVSSAIAVAGQSVDRSSVRYVNSADGKLSGVIMIQESSTRTVTAQLAGNIEGELVHLRARYDLGKGDQNDLIQKFESLIKSLTIDTSSRTKQAPAVNR